MDKTQATRLLGGSAVAAASAIGISPQAYGQWPDPLPSRLADRVIAALARRVFPDDVRQWEGIGVGQAASAAELVAPVEAEVGHG